MKLNIFFKNTSVSSLCFATLLLLALPVVFSACAVAAVAVAADISANQAVTKYPLDELADLKTKTAHFVLTKQMIKDSAAYRTAIQNVWNYTPIDFVTYLDAQQYLTQAGSVLFRVEDYVQESSVSNGAGPASIVSSDHLYLSLVRTKFETSKKGKVENVSPQYCQILLTPNNETVKLFQTLGREDVNSRAFIEDGEYYNLTPGMLALNLLEVQKNLEHGFKNRYYRQIQDKNELQKLAGTTLYVPVSVFSSLKSRDLDYAPEKSDIQNLMKKYPHQYKVISDRDLAALISQPDKPIYVLGYVQSASQTVITVFNSKTGIIYRNWIGNSWKLKAKNLAHIF